MSCQSEEKTLMVSREFVACQKTRFQLSRDRKKISTEILRIYTNYLK